MNKALDAYRKLKMKIITIIIKKKVYRVRLG